MSCHPTFECLNFYYVRKLIDKNNSSTKNPHITETESPEMYQQHNVTFSLLMSRETIMNTVFPFMLQLL